MTTATQEEIRVSPISTNSAKEYNDQAVVLTNQANSLVIKSQDQYESAAGLLRNIKDMARNLEEARKKITTPLDNAKKAVMDLFRGPATALETAEAKIKREMITYTNEQERLRRAEEEKLRKAAEAEEARKKKALEERAKKAEAAGKADKAEELRQEAEQVRVEAPVIAPTVQKPSGISMKQNWKARVVDVNKVPRSYMIVDEKKLDAIARATKGSLTIEGVEFYAEDVVASR